MTLPGNWLRPNLFMTPLRDRKNWTDAQHLEAERELLDSSEPAGDTEFVCSYGLGAPSVGPSFVIVTTPQRKQRKADT